MPLQRAAFGAHSIRHVAGAGGIRFDEHTRDAGIQRKGNGRLMARGRQMRLRTWVCLALAMAPCLSGCALHGEVASVPSSWQPPSETVAHPEGLPQIGKWMLNAQYEPAHWLGELYRGKNLREPINIVIADMVAQSAEEARKHLLQNFKAAGYAVRKGHSTGYYGYIDGVIYEQLPEGNEEAFSNEPSEMRNNHGRMFGPHPYQGGWVFIGAFSRESMDLLDKVKHRYVSFNQARDDLSHRLDAKTNYRIKAFLDLDNALIGDPTSTSGDHDGIAVLVIASGV